MNRETPPAAGHALVCRVVSFLVGIAVSAAAVASAVAAEPAGGGRRPPNILWLVGENISLDLGCYGEELVRTPHLDGLAADGMRYTRVYATSPVCAPSRSAFLTGMYQTTTDTHHMRSHRDDDFRLPPGVRPLTHRLREAGYFTANIKSIGERVVGTGKLDLNFVNEGPIYLSDDWSALKTNQPFFAQINLPEVEYDIYDRMSASKPRVEWVGEREHPPIATEKNVRPPPYYPDHPIARQEWARYLNSISGMDQRIGWVLEQLRTEGLSDDTVVIFFADNGRLEIRGIHWCYNSGLHVPMIIRWPRNFPPPPQYRPGTASDQLISLMDLAATTLRIAGLDPPEGMQSRVFLGQGAAPARDLAFSARDRIDETVQRIRSVHDGRYHYIRNFMPARPFTALNRYKEKCFPVMGLLRELAAEGKLDPVQSALLAPRLPAEELYDSRADPFEVRNLADSGDGEHRAVLARMRKELDRWMVETKDRGGEPEPPGTVEKFDREMHDWFGTPAWAESRR
jgi:N-sulfoglucosamine sulfohydrolase